MTVDPRAGSDLAPLPSQQILVVDPNLLDHHLVLSSFSHDSKIDPKAAETKSMKDESWRLATANFAKLSNFEGRKAKFFVWLCNRLNDLFWPLAKDLYNVECK